MTRAETEYLKGINAGKVFCSNQTWEGGSKGCHKDGVTLFQIHHGYGDTEPLSKAELAQLENAAEAHHRQHPDHYVRKIIWQKK